jgi:hypothetical protein
MGRSSGLVKQQVAPKYKDLELEDITSTDEHK